MPVNDDDLIPANLPRQALRNEFFALLAVGRQPGSGPETGFWEVHQIGTDKSAYRRRLVGHCWAFIGTNPTGEPITSEFPCRFRRSMQHPSGYLIWQYVSSGLILWGRSSLLPKQDAFSLLLCSRMILSLWNSWTWDFLLVLRRPIETAAFIRRYEQAPLQHSHNSAQENLVFPFSFSTPLDGKIEIGNCLPISCNKVSER